MGPAISCRAVDADRGDWPISMRTDLPPANVTCTTGSVGVALIRYRKAARLLTGNGDASVETGSNGCCRPLVGWACPGSPRRGPQDRDDEIVAKARTASG
jgi:hypothetical protein